MRIYLDNCCFNRPYDDQSQLKINLETMAKLDIQQQVRDGSLELVTSYILEIENAANPSEAKRADIQSFIDQYTKVYVSENKKAEIRRKAEEIMKTGVKLMDAYHIACALFAECEVFLSTDKRLLKYQTEKMRIINPVVFLLEQEEKE